MLSRGFNQTINTEPKKKKDPLQKKRGGMALGLGGLTEFVVSVLEAVVIICIFLTKKKSIVRKTREGQNCRVQTTKVATGLSLSKIKSAKMGLIEMFGKGHRQRFKKVSST